MLSLALAALPLVTPFQEVRVRARDESLIVRPDCADSLADQANPGNCLQASTVPTLGMLYPLSEHLFVDPGGYVGVGTTLPLAPLHVRGADVGGVLTVQNDGFGSSILGLGASLPGLFPSGSPITGVTDDPLENAVVGLAGANAYIGVAGSSYATLGSGVAGSMNALNSPTEGVFGQTLSRVANAAGVRGLVADTLPGPYSAAVHGENLGAQGLGIGVWGQHRGAGWGVYGTSASGIAIYAGGDLAAAGTKSFVQPHPTDASKEIRFVCLEGNESGTYFRGRSRTLDGRAEIEVPEEFRLVSEQDGLTVLSMPIGASANLWVESLDLERIVIRGDVDVEFSYFVNGVRRGFADHQSIVDNECWVPGERDVPYGTQYPQAVRDLLIENGTLNADYTPNETTAARLGWELSEQREPRRARLDR